MSNTAEILDLHADGLTLNEISAELGCSYNAARSVLWRRGIKCHREAGLTARDYAQGMTPLDAVEYLLGIIEGGTWVQDSARHEIDDWGVHFTKTERRILVALFGKRDALTYSSIYDATYFDLIDADSLPEIKTVQVHICKIRKKLPPFAKIITAWGVGCRLEVTE